jgi:hypothetical protein
MLSDIINLFSCRKFNEYLRQKALDKKYSLNEYTLTDIENNSFIVKYL